MAIAYHAQQRGDYPAIVSAFGERTYAELNANANRVARMLRDAGLKPGDGIAVVSRNRPEFVEILSAAERAGFRFTPINAHLKAEEIGYIGDNCEAKAFFADASLAGAVVGALRYMPNVKLSLAFGGKVEGYQVYEERIASHEGRDIDDPVFGSYMGYTSGSTGRPKGVIRQGFKPFQPRWGNTPDQFTPYSDVALCTGPVYHAAPFVMNVVTPLVSAATVVMMDGWDAEETLRLIDKHRVTHTHLVPTMLYRLLQLPDTVKQRYDLSSLKYVIHGAAPCPVHVKRGMIDWWGPIIWEYYGSTEGDAGMLVDSHEWLKKPGTLGRPDQAYENKIVDDNGDELPAGEVGTLYTKAPPEGHFAYFKSSEKTDNAFKGDHFTVGDMGYFDEDGYLFLTGRSAELIISGGVNIYPQEVDDQLLKHPAVLDVCTIGVADEEWGEVVKSVVQLNAGYDADDTLSAQLIAWARENLAHYKCPKIIDYINELPRLSSGKVQRAMLRDYQG